MENISSTKLANRDSSLPIPPVNFQLYFVKQYVIVETRLRSHARFN